MRLMDKFREVSTVKPGLGDSVMFWHDKWTFMGDSEELSRKFPRLYSFALNDKISVAKVFQVDDMLSLFYLPLSEQAAVELQVIQQAMLDEPLSGEPDK